jgi:hypothetical protein
MLFLDTYSVVFRDVLMGALLSLRSQLKFYVKISWQIP